MSTKLTRSNFLPLTISDSSNLMQNINLRLLSAMKQKYEDISFPSNKKIKILKILKE